MPKPRLSRRTVLRGLGVSMALPMLEAMSTSSALAAPSPTGPLRMGFFFVPNGVNTSHWFPSKSGALDDLPKTLEPLKSVRDYVTVISGLKHDKARANGDGAGDHARSAATFLTGMQARKTSGKDIEVGISADQFAAQQIGDSTSLPSLELGAEPGRMAGNCDSGYSCAYSNAISWRAPGSPMAKEINPRLVFERMFGDASKQEAKRAREQRAKYSQSILDFVRDDAKAISGELGRTDQRKLDEYLDAVRALEKRIESAKGDDPRDKSVDFPAPKGVPSDFGEHLRLMSDLLILAYQTDTTRISTFMLANEGSNRSYRDVGVREGHHSLSHHGGNKNKLDDIQKINEYHLAVFAYTLEKMKTIKEGNGTLLDNCMLVYGCAIGDGNRHNHDNLPVIFAGRAGGAVKGDRHIDVGREPMTNLFLTMFDHMGVKADQFGDSTGRLKAL